MSSKSCSQSKIEKIKNTLKYTREKRKSQECRVFKVKIQESSLSEAQRAALRMMFVEGKRVYNSALAYSQAGNKLDTYDTKRKSADVLIQGKLESKPLEFISSQMKQSIVQQLIASMKTLSSLKKKKKKIGKIKFKSSCNQLDLKQYKMTYKFKSSKRMKIQGIPGTVVVNGSDQFYFNPKIEYANAKLLNTPRGYYVAITTYSERKGDDKNSNLEEIGIDMGCITTITTSSGDKTSIIIKETERLKRLQKKSFRQVKNSNNYNKTKKIIAREYQKITNKKDDAANKICNKLLRHSKVYIQDENLRGWHAANHGKAVQHSVLGRIKSRLKKSNRVVVVDRFKPSTKACYCGHKNDIKLWDRLFRCEACGITEDRDIHAAKMIKIFGEDLIRAERTDFKPVDLGTSTDACEASIGKFLKMKQEAANL
jgi:transposase